MPSETMFIQVYTKNLTNVSVCCLKIDHTLNTDTVLDAEYITPLFVFHYSPTLVIYIHSHTKLLIHHATSLLSVTHDKSHLRIKPVDKICTRTWLMLPFDG